MSPDPTRERLLVAALEVFAAQGYEGASTRDICRAAGASNAAIHYHFGDKAAIYRELFVNKLGEFEQRMRGAGLEKLSGREALQAYYQALMRPLADDSNLAQQVYLHVREEFQPSGIVDDLRHRGVLVQMEVLGGFLQRELGLHKLDAALQRLVLALFGISLSYVIQRRSISTALPGLMEGTNWLNRLTAQQAELAWSMVEAERTRRKLARRARMAAG